MTRRLSEAEKAEIWDAVERVEAIRGIARKMGRAHGSIRKFMVANARSSTATAGELRSCGCR